MLVKCTLVNWKSFELCQLFLDTDCVPSLILLSVMWILVEMLKLYCVILLLKFNCVIMFSILHAVCQWHFSVSGSMVHCYSSVSSTCITLLVGK